jgi:tRNA (guanine26-N2/guanine27-N2)-dimethyltransferase
MYSDVLVDSYCCPCAFRSNTQGTHCDQCGKIYHIGGPIWSDPLHDVDFVKAVIEDITAAKEKYGTFVRMNGLLSVIAEELPESPLYVAPILPLWYHACMLPQH